jgi:hypothetical protein
MCRREGMSRHLPLLHRAGKSSARSSSSTGKSAIIEGEGWQGERSSLVVALSPHTSVDPRGAHPTALSILGGSREVSVHQMPCHFPSLPIHRLAPVGHAERSALKRVIQAKVCQTPQRHGNRTTPRLASGRLTTSNWRPKSMASRAGVSPV